MVGYPEGSSATAGYFRPISINTNSDLNPITLPKKIFPLISVTEHSGVLFKTFPQISCLGFGLSKLHTDDDLNPLVKVDKEDDVFATDEDRQVAGSKQVEI